MKRTKKYLFQGLILIFISSCSFPVIPKTEQDIFENSVVRLSNKISDASNKIAEHNIIEAYFDSINDKHIQINNWIGNIKGIQQGEYTVQNKEYLSIEFEIISKKGNCEISYSCIHLMSKDSIKCDPLYTSILNRWNLEPIIFSGEFRENHQTPELYNSTYPTFNISVSNIWKQK